MISQQSYNSMQSGLGFHRVSSLPNKLDASPLLRRQLAEERPPSVTLEKLAQVATVVLGYRPSSDHPVYDSIRKHFLRLPTRYAQDVDPEDVPIHMQLIQEAECGNGVALKILPHFAHRLPSDSPSESSPSIASYLQAGNSNSSKTQDVSASQFKKIVMVFRDKKNRLRSITAAMAACSMNICEAFACSSVDGYALDTFIVEGDFSSADVLQQLQAALTDDGKTPPHQKERRSAADGRGTPSGDAAPPSQAPRPPGWGGHAWEIDIQDIVISRKISEGGSGEMYEGAWNGTKVAIKKLKFNQVGGSNHKVWAEFCSEVDMLSKLRHPNIVLFLGACSSAPNLWIVTEYLGGGSLYGLLHSTKSTRLEINHVIQLAKEVACGMAYLHKAKIIHRDLKSANLVLDDNGHIKIVDFGLSRIKEESGEMTGETGSYRWAAPEILRNEKYDEKVDVYSFGCCVWEMVTGEVPFAKMTPIQAALAVAEKGHRLPLPPAGPNCPQALLDIVQDCWSVPERRPAFSEIIQRLEAIPLLDDRREPSNWLMRKLAQIAGAHI
eukprot:tig00000808_g4403.t1